VAPVEEAAGPRTAEFEYAVVTDAEEGGWWKYSSIAEANETRAVLERRGLTPSWIERREVGPWKRIEVAGSRWQEKADAAIRADVEAHVSDLERELVLLANRTVEAEAQRDALAVVVEFGREMVRLRHQVIPQSVAHTAAHSQRVREAWIAFEKALAALDAEASQ